MTGCMSGLPESEQTIADIYNIYKRIILSTNIQVMKMIFIIM